MTITSAAIDKSTVENIAPYTESSKSKRLRTDLGLLPVCDVSGELLHLRMAAMS
jgi:hypothetical protein